ncbi:protein atonal homolog 8-like [Notechis scutatus]|uniref:Protein atonal homolog 8 n=1 Tax=Notechis scutatus TaxID=8663 RepID=A0A6J1VPG2_9SAUR|nr:protein atonal homolog 8-like [Notechis scutatus]
MKNLQLMEAAAAAAPRWKRFCLKELRGIQKLKRRSRPGLGGMGQAGVPEQQLQQQQQQQAVRPRPPGFPPGGGRGVGALPGVAPFPAALRCPREEEEEEAPPSSAGVPKSPSPAGTLPARLLYHGGLQGGGASPRQRPSDPAGGGSSGSGAASEIKTLQQSRRLLANARERTRVHTISAAFEALRKQVPCYSYGQKLSKLAILRIACNYILSLARLADLDYSGDHSNLSFSECVEQCTRTLQAEGRSKKRKE